MKNYKVKALINFDDIEEKTNRNIGDIFNCTEERFLYLQSHNAVILIEIEKNKETKIKRVKKAK